MVYAFCIKIINIVLLSALPTTTYLLAPFQKTEQKPRTPAEPTNSYLCMNTSTLANVRHEGQTSHLLEAILKPGTFLNYPTAPLSCK